MSFRKILFLPHILSQKEKYIIISLLALTIATGFGFFGRIYARVTIPAPQVGGTYREGLLREPRNINPIYATTDGDRDIANLVFSSLFKYSGMGILENDLADHYEISGDGKTYTLALKKNVFWHDGKPLAADDVIFTINLIQNPQYKSPFRANWQGVGIEKTDEYSVKFTLRTAYAPFIENLTIGVIPKHLWENVGPEQAFLHELNLKPVGSGPYTFSSLTQEKTGSISEYQLSRNKSYYREGPYLKTIIFSFYATEEEMMAAWQRDRIDGFGPFPASRVKESSFEKARIVSVQMPRLFGVFFNDKKAPALADKNVRKAIAYALDRKKIADAVASSGAIVVDSPIPAENGYTIVPTQYSFDAEQARKLLETAGWKDLDNNGFREKKIQQKGKTETTPLRFILTTSDWPDLLRTAGEIQDLLKQVGMEIVVEKKSFNDLEAGVIRPRNFEILLFGQVYGNEPDPFAFWHSSQTKDPGLNIALYASKKADKLLEEARRLSDPAARNSRYQDLQKTIDQDIPGVFLYSQLYLYLLPRDLQGVVLSKISLPSERFNDINKWYRDTKRVLK